MDSEMDNNDNIMVGTVIRNALRSENDDATQAALQNSLVLSNICSYLPLADIQNVREVQSLWFEESNAQFRKRSKIVLYRMKGIVSLQHWAARFDDYMSQFPKYNHHQNFEISTNFNGKGRINSEYADRIIRFGILFGTHIKSLKLHGVFGLSSNSGAPDLRGSKFLNNVLRLAPNLEELKLDILLHRKGAFDLDMLLEESVVLQTVKKLEFEINYKNYDMQNDKQAYQEFCRKLVRVNPNLESLEFGTRCSTMFKITFLEEMRKYSCSAESTQKPPFSNFNTYKNCDDVWSGSVEILEPLGQLNHPLKRLDIGRVRLQTAEHVTTLQQILDKHRDTLEVFKIYCWEVLTQHKKIALPDLPKLKVLSFVSADYHTQTEARKQLYSIDVLNLLELFKSGPNAFSNKFPSLQSLVVLAGSCSWFEKITYDCFFPKWMAGESFVFGQITQLEVKYPQDKISAEYTKWTHYLANMFPNVHNSHLDGARLPKPVEVDQNQNNPIV